MIISHAIQADKEFRESHKAKTLAHTIRRHLHYHEKTHPERVSPAHKRAANAAIHALEQQGEINSDITRRLIRNPVQETIAEIFANLPPPTPRQYSEYEQALVHLMKQKGIEQRAAQHRTLLSYEIALRQHDYIIFNTLTVRTGEYYNVFNPNSTAFKNYIRSFDRLFNAERRGDVRRPEPEKRHNTYFACVEEGGHTGRLHLHILHFTETLPTSIQDPNLSTSIPIRRELTGVKTLWPYGFSTPIAVRTSPSDAWGRAGWRWPYDKKTSKSLPVNSPQALAGYMSKYVVKSYQSPKRSNLLWRVRKSHNLGLKMLHLLLQPLTPTQLLIATTLPIYVKLNNRRVPGHLIQKTAWKMYNHRHGTTPKLPSILALASDITPRRSPLQPSQDSIQDLMKSNQQNFGRIPTSHTSAEAASNEIKTILTARAAELSATYFSTPTGGYGTTSNHDHIY